MTKTPTPTQDAEHTFFLDQTLIQTCSPSLTYVMLVPVLVQMKQRESVLPF